MNLESVVARAPERIRDAVAFRPRYSECHALMVQKAQAGEFTIVDFWDTLVWLRGDWRPWRAFVKAVFGLPMDANELALYRRCTGREAPPDGQAREAWMPVGRRARKSATAAVIASYVAAYWDHAAYTARGELALIPIIAQSKADAHTIKRYVDAIFALGPLKHLVVRSTDDTIELSTGVEIMIRAASITAGRSRAIPLWVMDEIAFFRSEESANPDTEILRGLRPAQATVPKPLGLALSSPYARRGELWANYRAHYGAEGDRILVWQADTLTMHPGNPNVEALVAEEYERDSVSAEAEYGAQFRQDVEAFVSDELVESVTVAERQWLDPVRGVQYMAFLDPSGGRSDSMALAIAHWQPFRKAEDADQPDRRERVVLDLVHEITAPYNTGEAVAAVAGILERYGIGDVEGDHYAGEWPRDRFAEHKVDGGAIRYHVSEYPKREIYKNALPMLTGGRAELLDNGRMKAQLTGLDRRTSGSGQEIIDHAPGGHDDVANAVCGALFRADRLQRPPRVGPPLPAKTTHEVLRNDIQEGLERERARRLGLHKSPNPWLRRRR